VKEGRLEAYQGDDSSIRYPQRGQAQKLVVVDPVEELFQVNTTQPYF
jgi:hypothetical protein